MTPAIDALRKAGIPFRVHQYAHDPRATSFGREAAEALGIDLERMFKTLVVSLTPKRLVVAILPSSTDLDMKALAAAAGAKRAEMARPEEAQRATGYVVGGISPFGRKRPLATFLDATAHDHREIYVSGGKRGIDLSLAPSDLIRLLGATVAPIGR